MKWKILVICLTLLTPLSGFSFETAVPKPKAERKMTAETMIQLERYLGPNRWARGRDCNLTVEKRLVDRKFLSGAYNADVLFLDFTTAHLGPRDKQVSVTMDARWGSQLVTDTEFGPAEEIRIETGDYESTWIQFRHSGSHLLRFEIGNTRGLILCQAN